MAYPIYEGTGGIATGTGTFVTVPYPTTVNLNDILIAVVMDADNDTFGVPTGWTQFDSDLHNNLSAAYYWKRADGTETGNAGTFYSTSNAGSLVAGIIYRYSGCVESGVPLGEMSKGAISQVSSITFGLANLPSQTADRLVVGVLIVEDNTINNFVTGTPAFTEDSNLSTATGSDAHFAAISLNYNSTITTAPGYGFSASEYNSWKTFYLIPKSDITVTLNTPADLAEVTTLTPTVEFTGDDLAGDDLEYQVEIDTVDTFDTIDTVIDSFVGDENIGSSISVYLVGQSFTGDGSVLGSATAVLYTNGTTAAGSIVAEIYAHTGTFGTSSLPTGDALALSDPIDATTVAGTTVGDATSHSFAFPDKFTLVNGTKYCLSIKRVAPTGSTIYFVYEDASGTHAGNFFWNDNTYATRDAIFSVNTRSTIVALSSIPDAGFANTVTPADTHPFNDNEKIDYDVQEDLEIETDSYNLGASNEGTGFVGPVYKGQSFTGDGNLISAASWRLRTLGSPAAGLLVYKIYAHSGTFGTSSVPTGSALATSNSINVSTLTASYQDVKLTFPTPYRTVNGTKYVLTEEYYDAANDISNCLQAEVSLTGGTHGGNGIEKWLSTWQAESSGEDYNFIVYSDKSPLTDLTTYHWRARAIDPLGINVWSDWSTVKSFDVAEAATGLAGVINGAATITGILTAKGIAEGIINGIATTAGTLTVRPNDLITGSSNSIASGIESQLLENSEYDLSTSGASKAGQTFIGLSGSLKYYTVKIKDVGHSGLDKMELWTWDDTAKEPLVLQQVSINSFDENDINSSTFTEITFEFDGSYLPEGDYFLYIAASSINDIKFSVQNTDVYAGGTLARFAVGSWAEQSQDFWFELSLKGVEAIGLLTDKPPNTLEGVINGVATTAGILTAKGTLAGTVTAAATTVSVISQIVQISANVFDRLGLLENLKSVWELDETSGTNAVDSHDTNDGTSSGVTVNQTGKIGKAYSFNGTTSYIDIPNPSEYSDGNTLAFGFWFKTATVSSQTLLTLSDSSASPTINYINIIVTNDATGAYPDESIGVFDIRGGTSTLFTYIRKGHAFYNDNEWHKFWYVIDGVDNRLYMDGVKMTTTFNIGTATTAWNSAFTADLLTIGRRKYNDVDDVYFDGLIDGVSIYLDADITDDLVKKDWNNGHGLPYSSFLPLGATATLTSLPTQITGRSDSKWGVSTIQTDAGNSSFTGTREKVGSKFIGFNGTIKKFGVALRVTSGSPVHDIVAKIYSISAGLPDTVLQTSTTTIDVTTLTFGAETYYFDFDGTTNYNQDIAIVIEISNVTNSNISNKFVHMRAFGTSDLPNQNLVNWDSSWYEGVNDSFSYDLILVGATQGILTGRTQLLGVINTNTSTVSVLLGKGALGGSSEGTAAATDGTLGTGVNIQPIAVVVNGIATVSGILIADGILQGIISTLSSVDGTASARGDLATIVNGVTTTTGVLKGKGLLSSTVNGTTTTTSDLTSNAIYGVSTGVATITGVLIADGKLEGSSDPIVALIGTLVAKGELEVTINGIATVDGILTAKGILQGIINGVATTVSDLTSNSIAGTVTTLSTVDGTLTAKGELASLITSTTTTIGVLTSKGLLEGIINGIATVQGTGLLIIFGTSTVNGIATVDGILTAKGSLASSIDNNATVDGILKAKGLLAGSSDGVATVDGAMLGIKQLVGEINGAATVTAWIQACAVGGTTFEKPISDTATGSWTVTPLWSKIDDGQAEDNVTIVSEIVANGVSSTFADGTFDSSGDPLGNVGHILRAKWASSSTRDITAYLELWQGTAGSGTLIATCTVAILDATEVLTEYTLTGTEADNITDYANLEWRLYGIGLAGGPSRSLVVDFIEFEVPGTKQVLTVGIITGQATVTGELINSQANSEIDGTINGVATTSGILTAKGELAGISTCNSTVDGELTSIGPMEAESNGVASLSGLLNSNLQGSVVVNTTTITFGTLTGDGELGGSSDGVASTFGLIGSKGFISANVIIVVFSNGTLTGTGALEVSIDTDSVVLGELKAKGILEGIINGVATSQGILVSDAMFGVANGIATTSGELTANGVLIGSVAGLTTTTGEIIAKGLLSGIVTGVATTDGGLQAIGLLSAIVTASATVTGILTSDAMSGVSNGATSINGVLNAKGSLVGTSLGQTSIVGDLVSDAMAAISNGLATTQGILSAKGTLQSTINTSTTTTATLSGIADMVGASNGASTTTATIHGKGLLLGSSDGNTTVDGVLSGDTSTTGTINGSATVSGTLNAIGILGGESNGVTTINGDFPSVSLIEGISNGIANVTGTLTQNEDLSGSSNGNSVVVGTLLSYQVLDEKCYESVIYIEKGPYAVRYKEHVHPVQYSDDIFVVNYQCKKTRK